MHFRFINALTRYRDQPQECRIVSLIVFFEESELGLKELVLNLSLTKFRRTRLACNSQEIILNGLKWYS